MNLTRLLTIALTLILAGSATAQLRVSLPLQGWYRPGRYMPVRVVGGVEQFTITAPGAMPTIGQGGNDLIVPFLCLQPSSRLTVEGHTTSAADLRPLDAAQRLIGVVDGDYPADLFPDAQNLSVRLVEQDLRSTPAAWQSLDALVVARRDLLSEPLISALLSAGTIIVCAGEHRPDTIWPWKQSGSYWILRHDLGGPRRAGENAPAMSPAGGWEAQWPAAIRQQAVLTAAMVAIGSLGAALLRGRWAAILVILTAAGGVGAMLLWHRTLSPLQQARTQVLIDSQFTQIDSWRYLTSIRPYQFAMPWHPTAWPIAQYPDQLAAMRLSLICGSDGSPIEFIGTASATPIAVLERELKPAENSQPIGTIENPRLDRLIRRVYTNTDVVGQLVAPRGNWWGTVVLHPR